TTYASQGVVVIDVPLAGNGSDGTSIRALRTLRGTLVPATLSTVDGVHAYVGGNLAFSVDFNDQLRHSLTPVLAFVMGMAFLLMLFSFRSVVIAAVSIMLTVLSVA